MNNGGCIATVPLENLDMRILDMIYNGKIKPLKVDFAKVPVKKWIPFLRKEVWYVELQYVESDER
jgi:hypothetical protein